MVVGGSNSALGCLPNFAKYSQFRDAEHHVYAAKSITDISEPLIVPGTGVITTIALLSRRGRWLNAERLGESELESATGKPIMVPGYHSLCAVGHRIIHGGSHIAPER